MQSETIRCPWGGLKALGVVGVRERQDTRGRKGKCNEPIAGVRFTRCARFVNRWPMLMNQKPCDSVRSTLLLLSDGKLYRRKLAFDTKIAAINASAAERLAHEIATFGIYAMFCACPFFRTKLKFDFTKLKGFVNYSRKPKSL